MDMQLENGIQKQPRLNHLAVFGELQMGIYITSRTLTSLEMAPRKEIGLLRVTCPALVNVHLPSHVHHLGPVILKNCPWLEQPEELQSTRNVNYWLYSIKWLNSRVVDKKGGDGRLPRWDMRLRHLAHQ